MRQQWLASSYRTADVLAAFSQASAEADAIDHLLHAGSAYWPDDDTPTQSRRPLANDDPWRRIDRVQLAVFNVLIWALRGGSRLPVERETSKFLPGRAKQPPAGTPLSGELMSHFAFPHASDRERSASALRARNDPA